jgi:uncharacterized protein YecE (DUF72 family)
LNTEKPVDTRRVGTQGWNYGAWVGPFYPPGTRPADFLKLYAQAFDTVEVDSTFYAVPAPKVVRAWAARTPPGFQFALKLPQEATHERHLREAMPVVDEFLESARELGDKLGPVLVQLGPDFRPAYLPELEAFVAGLDSSVRWAVEVRNRGWTEEAHLRHLLDLLGTHRVALALTDGPWLPRSLATDLVRAPTADFHYLRFMGPNRDIVDYSHVQFARESELDEWTGAVQSMPGLDVHCYFNNHFSGHSPATAREMQRRLGIQSVDPRELGEQTSLF